ncbi:MAG: cobalt-zinc-cadmium efflux system outer membrane protein [Saprospiraceae bacterium]|jgi:cobalt-zinc-cadmium efflux system outer membrane protein
MNKWLITFLLFSLIGNSVAQSVENLIEMAYEHNPGLEALRLQYASAKEKAAQVADYPDPTMRVGLGVLPIETRLGAQRLKIGVTQMIPWKGLLAAKKEMVASQAEIYSNIDQVKEIDIAYAIRSAYSTIVLLEDKTRVIQSKLELLDVLEDLAKSAVRSGKGKLSNVLLIQRSRQGLESDLGILKKRKERPTISINRWAGRNLTESIDLISDVSLLKTEAELIQFANGDHPQYQILENQINASQKAIELTEYESRPKIGVGLDYAFIDGRNDVATLAGNGRDVLMPMGSISIPLHTGRYTAKRQEEKLKQEAIHSTMKDLQEMYQADIAAAYSQNELSLLEIDRVEGLKNITRETLNLMRTEYASEGTIFEELLRLEMELIDYDLIIAQSKYTQLLAKATLLKYQRY